MAQNYFVPSSNAIIIIEFTSNYLLSGLDMNCCSAVLRMSMADCFQMQIQIISGKICYGTSALTATINIWDGCSYKQRFTEHTQMMQIHAGIKSQCDSCLVQY